MPFLYSTICWWIELMVKSICLIKTCFVTYVRTAEEEKENDNLIELPTAIIRTRTRRIETIQFFSRVSRERERERERRIVLFSSLLSSRLFIGSIGAWRSIIVSSQHRRLSLSHAPWSIDRSLESWSTMKKKRSDTFFFLSLIISSFSCSNVRLIDRSIDLISLVTHWNWEIKIDICSIFNNTRTKR